MALAEQDLVRISERYTALATALTSMAALPLTVVEIKGSVTGLSRQFSDLSKDFEDFKKDLSGVNKLHVEERRSLKVALIGLIGVIAAALIGGIFLLVAKGAFG